MKRPKIVLFCLMFLVLAACRPSGSVPPPVTPTAVPPTITPEFNEVAVEVTRVVVTAGPTATPVPCTPLLEGMRLTISMAEQESTIVLDAEGLLPEDKPIVRLNGRSPNHGSEMELVLANPVGPDGRFQESFYLGENDITEWSGQIIHQRGAVCFEFIFPLIEPLVLEALEPTPTAPRTSGEAAFDLPPATELLDPVAAAGRILLGDWSPDGRFLPYKVVAAEEILSPTLGSTFFYDTIAEQSCPFGDYGIDHSSRAGTYVWLSDGNLFVYGGSEIAVVQPCGDALTILTDRFPDPNVNLVAWTADKSTMLFATETSFWLYQTEGHQVRSVTGFDPALADGAAFSPDGRFVAFNGEEGGSYLLDVAAATIAPLTTWQAPLGAGGQANPQWITNTQFVTRNSNDLGPLLIDVDGAVQNAGLAFFDEPAPPESALFAFRDDENGRFHLLLQTFSSDVDSLQLYHSETGEAETIALEGYRWADGTSNQDPHWLFINARSQTGDNELLIRPMDPPHSVPQPISTQDTFSGITLAGDQLALGVGERVDLWQLPDMSVTVSYTAVNQTMTPRGFSPNGRFLAIITTNPDGAQSLFIQPSNTP